MNDAHLAISNLVKSHPVVLFMKGVPDQPQCGFSATTVQALRLLGASFHHVNVLEDDAIRTAVKSFSNWPTIPQLYVNGELVGGCDIVREMFETGELSQLLQSHQILTTPAS